MTNSQTSRRTVLTGLAAASIVAFPVVKAAAEPHPDAELIAAWYRVLDLERQYDVAAKKSEPYWAAMDRWLSWAKEQKRFITNEEWDAAHEDVQKRFPLPKPDCDDISDMMDEPMRKVMNLPARTPDGLVCKAQLVRMEKSELWEEPVAALDWEDMKLRALVDGVLSFAGNPA